MGWDESRFCLSVVRDHRQFIHCKVQLIDSGKICWITFVYGLNIIADRRPLWQELMQLRGSFQGPWLVIGDFNAVYDPSHRGHGRKVSNYETKDFRDCISASG